MLLTITTTRPPATDLGYLLHKSPARVHELSLSFGQARVFYPEAGRERCTAALLLDVDPVALVRRSGGPSGEGGALEQYVNDRPYAASSFLSVAMAQCFSSALAGRSRERQALAEEDLPLEARLCALPCRGGERLLRSLFEPLGYAVAAEGRPLDEAFPAWGAAPYYKVTLTARCRLSELLRHLYVLVPVLDDDKHYWVGDDEVEKLLRRGEGWLKGHPQRELIAHRYLKHQRRLAREALARLLEEDLPDPDASREAHAREEEALEERISLNEERMGAVMSVLRGAGARRVLDLGCGEGKLLKALLRERAFSELVGLDVSCRALQVAAERLRLERLSTRDRDRVRLIQGSLMYRDRRLEGYDAAAVVEVVEHLDPPRLRAFERALFEFARPGLVVLTTPNAEHNVRFPGLAAGKFRHPDHRFEWSRAEFQAWSAGIAGRFGYRVRFLPVGREDPEVGPPTQMGVFSR